MIIATHQRIVSDVFMAVQGYRTVAYAFPVFDGNTYAGSLSLLIPFELIAGEYLADIRIGKEGYAWMISGKGIQLYTPEKGRVGTDVLKSFSNYPALMDLVGRMMNGEEGSTTYEYKHLFGELSETGKYHATFVPVRLPNNHWSLAVSVPESELAAPIRAFRNKWLLVMAFLIAAALVLSFYVVRAWWMVEEANRRKAAEKALRESEAKFRELAELLPQTVFEMDAQGFITYINRHGLESTGYTEEDIADGLYAFNLQVPEERERAKENFEKILRGEDKGPHEYRVKRKDGSIFPCMTYTRPIVRDGEVVGARGILVDLTEQKRAEEERIRLLTEIRQTQKMDAIGRLAGGIAHDFNNILNALLGYSELALHKISDRDVVERSLRAIMKAGERARDLVKQILTFSRKAGEDMEPLDPARLVESGIDFLRASFPSTVEIEHEIRHDAGLIMANPSQFEQVIVNLCTNAVHAMNQRGVLKISLAGETVTEEDMDAPPRLEPGRYVKLSVSDTGAGMDEGTVERIFEPFFTTKDVGKGTGMGLAVVQGIVKSHGGAIEVNSKPGEGSTFHVFFPVIEGYETEKKDAGDGVARGSERILFVDDEKTIVDMAAQMLEYAGYRVTTFDDGMLALDHFTDHPGDFDIAVLDQTMPRIEGSRLAERMLRIRPDFPIILCTGYSTSISEQEAVAMGIKAFVMKPINIMKLTGIIRSILDANRVESG